MNLRHLTDDALLVQTDRAVQTERNALSAVLHHFREIDRRRLYSKLKYKSLYEYAVKHQRYSEREANSRIDAMKLLKELPELEAKINEGSLTLSNIEVARRFFRLENERRKAGVSVMGQLSSSEDPPTDQSPDLSNVNRDTGTLSSPEPTPEKQMSALTSFDKLSMLSKIENVSKNEATKIFQRETGIVVQATESIREVNSGQFEMKALIDKEAVELATRLRGLLAHSHPNLSNGELIKMALGELARRVDPLEKAKRAKEKDSRKLTTKTPPAGRRRVKINDRYIPAAVRHAVWLRDGGVCTKCGSSHAVQHEHIIAVALGGKSTVENVTLFCRSCNQRSAIEAFGVEKMRSYLRSPACDYSTRVSDSENFFGIQKGKNSRDCRLSRQKKGGRADPWRVGVTISS